MRSSIARKILEETPQEYRLFTQKHAEILVRIDQLMKSQKLTQKQLATKLNKAPSEISKWLKGQHNFTLRSLCKLEAVLGASLFEIPQEKVFKTSTGSTLTMTVSAPKRVTTNYQFQESASDSFEGKSIVKYG